MTIPSRDSILSLDYSLAGSPFCLVGAKSTIVFSSLDWAGGGVPFVGIEFSGGPEPPVPEFNVLIDSSLSGVTGEIILTFEPPIPERDVIISSLLEDLQGDIILSQVERFEQIKVEVKLRANSFEDISVIVKWIKDNWEDLYTVFEVVKAGTYDFEDMSIIFEAVQGDRFEDISVIFSVIREVQEFSSYIMMKLYITCSELTEYGDLTLLDWNVKPNRTWYVRVTGSFVVLFYTMDDLINDTNAVASGTANDDKQVVLTKSPKFESGVYDNVYIRLGGYGKNQPLYTHQTLRAYDYESEETQVPEGTEFSWVLVGPGALNNVGWTDINRVVTTVWAIYSSPVSAPYENAIILLYCNGVLIDTKVINGTEDVIDEYEPTDETLEFYYQDLPYHLSLSDILEGDEYDYITRCFKINPLTDLSEIRDPIYNNSNLVIMRGEAELNLHTNCCLNKEIVLATHLPTLELGEIVSYQSDRRSYTEKSQVLGHTINGNPDALITTIRTATYLELVRRTAASGFTEPIIRPTDTPTPIPMPTTTTTTTTTTPAPTTTTTGTGTGTPTTTPYPTTTSGIKEIILRPIGDYDCHCYLYNSSTHYGAVNTSYSFTNHSTVGVNKYIYAPCTNPVPPAQQQILRDLFYIQSPGLSNVSVVSVTVCGFGANWHSDQMILFHIQTTGGLQTSPNRGTWNWVNVSYTWYDVVFPNINSIIAGVTLASVRESDYQPPDTLEIGPLAQLYLVLRYIQH